MDDDKRGRMSYLKEYAKYSSLIFQMIAMVAAGVLGGIQLDRYFSGKGHIITILLTICTTFAAIYYLFRTLLKK